MSTGLLSTLTTSFCKSLASICKGSIKCVFLNNRPCQARPTFVGINSNETLFYQFTGSVNKCGIICNTIDESYAQVCVPNKVEDVNVKVFNMTLGVCSTWIV